MLFHDGNCNDCDFGTTVDRIMLTLRMWNHFVDLVGLGGLGADLGLVTNQSLTGWNYNIDNVAEGPGGPAIGRRDSDGFIADALRHNKPVINYGCSRSPTSRTYDLTFNPRGRRSPLDYAGAGCRAIPVKRLPAPGGVRLGGDPSIYGRGFGIRSCTWRPKGATTFGDIGNISVYGDSTATTAQKATMQIPASRGLVRGHYKFLRDSLTVGLEVGSATGTAEQRSHR